MKIKLFPMEDTSDGERQALAERGFATMSESCEPVRGWNETFVSLSVAQAQELLRWLWEALPADARPLPRFE